MTHKTQSTLLGLLLTLGFCAPVHANHQTYVDGAPATQFTCPSTPVGTTVDCPEMTLVWRNGASANAYWETTKPLYFREPTNEFELTYVDCPLGVDFGQEEVVCTFTVRYSPIAGGSGKAELSISGRTKNADREPTSGSTRYYALEGGVEPDFYVWSLGEAGECVGGSGEWVLGEWFPLSGCGLVEQTRTSFCAVDANSGTQTHEVRCVRESTGNAVSEYYCDPLTRPSASQACTPEGAAVCGETPLTAREVKLANACGCVPDPENSRYCVKLSF